MREMRRKDRQRDQEFALRLFQACEYAVLATVNEDGSPYCIPISPVLTGESTLYFHCALEGQKMENMQREARVCLSCIGATQVEPEHFTTKYQSAVAYGRAKLVEDPQEKVEALRALCLKYTPSNMENFDQAVKNSISRTGIYRIDLETVTGKEKK